MHVGKPKQKPCLDEKQNGDEDEDIQSCPVPLPRRLLAGGGGVGRRGRTVFGSDPVICKM